MKTVKQCIFHLKMNHVDAQHIKKKKKKKHMVLVDSVSVFRMQPMFPAEGGEREREETGWSPSLFLSALPVLIEST